MKKKCGSTLTITLVVLVVISIMGITISGVAGIVLRTELNRISGSKVELEFENSAYDVMNTIATDSKYVDSSGFYPIVVNNNGEVISKTNPVTITKPIQTTYYYTVEFTSDTKKDTGFVSVFLHREGRPKGCYYIFSYAVSSETNYFISYKLVKTDRVVW